jgi:hypothetical protein
LKRKDLRVFLKEIPTYLNLCNLQMQAKRKRKQRGFTPVPGYRKTANERRPHDPREKDLNQSPAPQTREEDLPARRK